MAIRINTNIASMNAQRNLDGTNRLLNRTLERLSSGLRINRAADDAAGLAVSEKLRTQIRGFGQATANAQDAINLVATAESGLDQSTAILQRMRELAIQSASDTLVNEDREKIQTEINQLRLELTRIAETTEFNTRSLLDGSIAQAQNQELSSGEVKANPRIGDLSGSLSDFFASTRPYEGPTSAAGITTRFFDGDRVMLFDENAAALAADVHAVSVDVAFEIKVVSYQAAPTAPVSVAIEVYNSVSGFLYSLDPADSASFANQGGAEGLEYGDTAPSAQLYLSMLPPSAANFRGGLVAAVALAPGLTLTDIGKTALIQINAPRRAVTVDSSLTFQVGANEGQFLKMGVQDMRAAALRLETVSLLGTNDNDSRLKAQNAIGVIDQALDYVGSNRARLGAFQNRLEYTIQNLQVSQENLAASESRIRDADIAAETAQLTRAQILIQAGTAVLSQANAAPQSALRLIGG